MPKRNNQWVFRYLSQLLSPCGDETWVGENLPKGIDEWQSLIDFGKRDLLLPSLYLALKSRNLFGEIPESIQGALVRAYISNRHRNKQIRNQMIEISASLNGIGVSPIWLKGATNLLRDNWQKDARAMVDLDFLVAHHQSHDDVISQLSSDGYHLTQEYPDESAFRTHHHYAPRFKMGRLVPIEFHKHICEAKLHSLLKLENALSHVEWVHWEGRRVGRLGEADRLMNSYLQCMNRDCNYNFKLTTFVSIRKSADFLEKFISSSDQTRQEFLGRLHIDGLNSGERRFLSILSYYFGLEGMQIDEAYLAQIANEADYPKLYYALYMANRAFDSILNGRIGRPKGWRIKISRHMQNLHNS